MGFWDWLWGKDCVGCGREGRYVCQKCRLTVMVRGESLRYTGVVRQLLKEVKYRGSFDMVGELVELWEQKARPLATMGAGKIVTAVPLWDKKRRKRGFNQAELIAREWARRRGWEYRELLRRTRETKPMYGLKRKERYQNVAGAFAIRGAVPREGEVLLVDDVWTSGATMQEAARVLKRAGVRRVREVAVAR